MNQEKGRRACRSIFVALARASLISASFGLWLGLMLVSCTEHGTSIDEASERSAKTAGEERAESKEPPKNFGELLGELGRSSSTAPPNTNQNASETRPETNASSARSAKHTPLFVMDGELTLLAAEPFVVIRPMPPAEEAIEARIRQSAAGLRILSPFGVIGEGPVMVATLTRIERPFRRAFLIGLDPTGAIHFLEKRVSVEELGETLRDERLGRNELVLLTAAPETPIRSVGEVAILLEERFDAQLALGALLPQDVRYIRKDPPSGASFRCDKNPSIERRGPAGELSTSALRAPTEALHRAIRQCVSRVPPTWLDENRTSRLRLRVDASGRIAAACLDPPDALSEPQAAAEFDELEAFGECVVQEIRPVRFPAPDPSGDLLFSLLIRFESQ